eukprot:7863210-Ditylum_brightwellii.AAC.2
MQHSIFCKYKSIEFGTFNLSNGMCKMKCFENRRGKGRRVSCASRGERVRGVAIGTIVRREV